MKKFFGLLLILILSLSILTACGGDNTGDSGKGIEVNNKSPEADTECMQVAEKFEELWFKAKVKEAYELYHPQWLQNKIDEYEKDKHPMRKDFYETYYSLAEDRARNLKEIDGVEVDKITTKATNAEKLDNGQISKQYLDLDATELWLVTVDMTMPRTEGEDKKVTEFTKVVKIGDGWYIYDE